MKVHYGLENIGEIKNAVVTVGSFDGVHIGHKYIIGRLNKIAKEIDGESVLVSFYPHPRQVLYPKQNKTMLINSQQEKIEVLKQAGLNHLVIIEFTIPFSKIEPMDFIRKILVDKIHLKKIVIGYDHNFGHNGEGNFEYLYELGKYFNFGVEEIMAQDIEHVSVSSTKIRRALSLGDIETVNTYLGHSYFIRGIVTQGSRLGRKIGFRTARIRLDDFNKLIPQIGVYIVSVKVDNQEYTALLNIGALAENSESEANRLKNLNLHILNFDKEIYGKEIDIILKQKLREEYNFSNLNSLKSQLYKDIKDLKHI